MNNYSRLLLLSFVIHSFIATCQTHDVELLDEKLIGMRMSKAIRLLDLDTNWQVINEPPGKWRGINAIQGDTCKIQLIGTTKYGRANYKTHKGRMKLVGNMKVIGVSWIKDYKCNSVGNVIGHYAYNRFGPCDEPLEIDRDSSWLAAYYLMDDNWSDESDTAKINTWKKEKLRKLMDQGPVGDIFGHSGAGMAGTEWNPETDIFCVGHIRIEDPATLHYASAYVFDEELVFIPTIKEYQYGGTYFFVTLPREYWQKRTKPVTMENVEEVYADQPGLVQQWKNARAGKGEYEGFDLLLGEYLEVNFVLRLGVKREIRFTKILHALYGE